jgi:hypothetical protein
VFRVRKNGEYVLVVVSDHGEGAFAAPRAQELVAVMEHQQVRLSAQAVGSPLLPGEAVGELLLLLLLLSQYYYALLLLPLLLLLRLLRDSLHSRAYHVLYCTTGVNVSRFKDNNSSTKPQPVTSRTAAHIALLSPWNKTPSYNPHITAWNTVGIKNTTGVNQAGSDGVIIS